MSDTVGPSKVRHILSISGGKDSAALAVYMRDRVPDMEYVFCDTREELPDTYDYLRRLEAYLGKPIHRLYPDHRFSQYLKIKGGYLPSPQIRWCTSLMKIRPFEIYVGNDEVRSYIGIRADEDREGYISSKPNILPVYPFREDGIDIHDVHRILEEAGLGLPAYYSWRSRSGCYFCFFQRRIEWVGLLENYPELFDRARQMEHMKTENGQSYTWVDRESLDELRSPERIRQIKEEHEEAMDRERSRAPKARLVDVFSSAIDASGCGEACTICRI